MQKVIVISMLALSCVVAVAGCEKKPETPVESVTEAVKDGLDARPNEAIKDAGESTMEAAKDIGAAAKDTGEKVGAEVKEAAEKAKDAVTPH